MNKEITREKINAAYEELKDRPISYILDRLEATQGATPDPVEAAAVIGAMFKMLAFYKHNNNAVIELLEKTATAITGIAALCENKGDKFLDDNQEMFEQCIERIKKEKK